jgi:membrane associated rhomboid family serine protease
MASILEEIKHEFKNGSMLSRIILVNVFIFLAINILNLLLYVTGHSAAFAEIVNLLALPENPHLFLYKPWTLFTHIFLHIEIGHIFFNMLTLYWFGSIFKEYLGEKKLLPVFMYGGIAGAILSLLSYFILPNAEGIIMGASAGILAIVVATSTLLPDYTISLILIGPVRLKYVAMVMVGIDLISIPKGDHTAHIAHIGGAILGFVFIKQLKKGNDWSLAFNKVFDSISALFNPKPKPKITVVHKAGRPLNDEEYSVYKKSKQEVVDHILDKISKSGYESLSKQEKEILFKMSKE